MLLLALLSACSSPCGFDAYGGGPVTVTWLDAEGAPVGPDLVFPGYDAATFDAFAATDFETLREASFPDLAVAGEQGAVLFTPLGDEGSGDLQAFGAAAGSFLPGLGGECTGELAWAGVRLYRDFDGADTLVLEAGDEGNGRTRVRASWSAPESCEGDAVDGACEGPVDPSGATCSPDLDPTARVRVAWSFDRASRVRVPEPCETSLY